MSIIEFVRSGVDEDERIALAASEGPWKVDNSNYPEAIYDGDGQSVVSGGRWGGEASIFSDDADAFHMVRHDPARVLREVAAKRAVLEYHREVTEDHEESWMWSWYNAQNGESQACVGCGWSGDPDHPRTDRIEDCPELRAMASVYIGHADYQKEWVE